MKRFFKHPAIIVVLILIITAAFIIPMRGLVVKNSAKSFFPSDHPSFLRIENLGDTYGSSIFMDICLTADEGTIFKSQIIKSITDITAELEDLELVDSVQSISNTDFPDGTSEGMVVSNLVSDDFSGTDEELAELKNNLMDWGEMYSRSLYSNDLSSTQILVTIDKDITEPQMHEMYLKVKMMMNGYQNDGFSVIIAGDPVLTQVAEEYMYADLSLLIPVVILVVLLSLFFSFKKLDGTLLPAISVVISTIWTVGIMSIVGTPFSIVSTCLPILLIAVGSAYGIHVMTHYYHDRKLYTEVLTKEENTNLVINSLHKVLRPVFLAGFTTIIGFISITSSPIKPLKDFGIYSAVGVAISLMICITFIPALMILKYKEKPEDEKHQLKNTLLTKAEARKNARFDGFYEETGAHRGRIIFFTLIIVILSFAGFSNLNIESALISYFPVDSSIRVDSSYISEKFGGTNTFNVVVKGQKPGDLANPEVLCAMDELKNHLLINCDNVGKILSYSDFIKRMNKVMNYPSAPVEDGGYDEDFAADSFFDDGSSDEAESFSFFGDDSFGDAEIDAYDEDFAADTPVYLSLGDSYTAEEGLALLDLAVKNINPNNLNAESVITYIKKEFNYRGAAYNEIPSDPVKYGVADIEELKNLISQYLLLYSGSLDSFSDDAMEPSQARMLIELKDYETNNTGNVMNEIDSFAGSHFPEGYSVEITGLAEMEYALTDMITSSQIKSLLLAMILVFIVVAISYRSIVAGFFGIIPLLFAILINFGIMGFFHINLDMVTSLIASIAIGIGVDYTIHFLERYHQERLLSDDLSEVTKNTIRSSGKGIITNARSCRFWISCTFAQQVYCSEIHWSTCSNYYVYLIYGSFSVTAYIT